MLGRTDIKTDGQSLHKTNNNKNTTRPSTRDALLATWARNAERACAAGLQLASATGNDTT
eukprot:6902184-Lingulodinium_polyedra.AAC.1